MKLSEAILLGSTLAPQIKGGLNSNEGTCALGAAYQATGILETLLAISMSDDEDRSEKALAVIRNTFPRVQHYQRDTSCPMCPIAQPLMNIVIHLNDQHGWTRERIAEWVATVEPSELEEIKQLAKPDLSTEVVEV